MLMGETKDQVDGARPDLGLCNSHPQQILARTEFSDALSTPELHLLSTARSYKASKKLRTCFIHLRSASTSENTGTRVWSARSWGDFEPYR